MAGGLSARRQVASARGRGLSSALRNSLRSQERPAARCMLWRQGMDWPHQRIETQADFRPPHCPWIDCPAHPESGPAPFRFRRHGFFRRQCDGRRVPRFFCRTCRRTFSQQTFATSYWLKRPDLQNAIGAQSIAGSAIRQIARSCRCAHSSVHHQLNRLGRHALLLLQHCLLNLALDEPLAYDDFESFAFCQLLPYATATPVGLRSRYLYALGYAPHRRGGRLTPAQKRAQQRLDQRGGRPPRGAYRRSARAVLELLLPRVPPGDTLVLACDGHKAYRQAWADWIRQGRLKMLAFPNPRRRPKGAPRSPEALLRDRALFPVDQYHGFKRHSRAHHRRETIAFGRRANDQLTRDALLAVFRNLIKKLTERRPCRLTPAMLVGLTEEPWDWDRLLARRLFFTHLPLPALYLQIYKREIRTAGLKVNRPKHNLHVC